MSNQQRWAGVFHPRSFKAKWFKRLLSTLNSLLTLFSGKSLQPPPKQDEKELQIAQVGSFYMHNYEHWA